MLNNNNLAPKSGAIRKKKKVGRGTGSGHGKTCGRGHKGQTSRSGGTKGLRFEGGQTPIYRRLPKKRGFKNLLFRDDYRVVNLKALSRFGEEITIADFINARLLKEGEKLKILGEGEIKKPLIVTAHKFSESAKKKIESAGGKAILC
ncbi:MAG: large subunit ribosomal protein L15 [Candidatus Saganbacteria bacterium]|uniref:Large ribosomal subunit protein uL15 n=1 Tax=Candidatus Saganbacteria bacterium TaxID=2575572 RepID=A0A833L3Q6_UNCSA|nr:MAG: large subunit ribosomal protein L15 [Candidatus Saganbacteria bacterium]